MEKKYRIYRYTNILSGMKYHGKTCRKYQSVRAGHDGKGYYLCPKFGEAIKEYGWLNFKYEVLEDGLTKEEAEVREKYWIEHDNSIWPNGYNIQSGGAGAPGTHPIRSDEWKKKQSESHKGKRVCQYSKDGEFLAEYPSFHEASRQTGTTKECISRCCVGKIKTAGGYVWSLSN